MKTDNIHIQKIRQRIGHGILLAILFLVSSCSKEESIYPDNSSQATLSLEVSSFSQQGNITSRSVTGDTDENRVRDIWVFQFDAETGTSLQPPMYLSGLDNIQNIEHVEFQQNDPGKRSRICVVANTHGLYWAKDESNVVKNGFNTYHEFQNQQLPDNVCQPFLASTMGNASINGNTIPMYGELEIVIIDKTYVRVPLYRMFAKIIIKVDPSYLHDKGMEIENITCAHIPYYSQVKEIESNSEYPEDENIWKDWDLGKENEHFFYIPENIQGVVDDMTDKQTATEGFPRHALKVVLKIGPTDNSHTAENGSEPTEGQYTIYPGMNMDNDFNIKRNHIYNVTISVKNDEI